MSYNDIFKAIRKPIIDGIKFGLPWAFENEQFTPPTDGSAWARLSILPAQPDPVEIGAVLTDEVNGIAQFDLFYPADQGQAKALDKAQEIKDAYPRAANLIYGGAAVRVSSSGISQGAENEPYYHVFVTIEWVSYTCSTN